MYEILKTSHITFVAVSGVLFCWRGFALIIRGEVISRWLRILPHVNDTLLLASAIGMLGLLGLNPLTQPWLMAKIFALLAYITLGMAAFRMAKNPPTRLTLFGAALLTYCYIVSVALTKSATLL